MVTAALSSPSFHPEAPTPANLDIQELAGRLESLERGLFTKLTDLLHPLTEKIDQLTLTLQKVGSVAEEGMNLSIVQQEEIKELQECSASHEEQLAILGYCQRSFNLKFRALEEGMVGSSDLIAYISNWLATTLDLQGEAYPVITQAFRLGSLNKKLKPMPRDIIATFADARVRNKILKVAREKQRNNAKISVCVDLTPETLKKKKELKEIMALSGANVRYRWATALKLQINHNGKTYYATTEEEGFKILKHLNISIPMQTEKLSFKRKSSVLHSPLKTNKKHSADSQC